MPVGSHCIRIDRSEWFPAPPEVLWEDLQRFDDFERDWIWLRSLKVEGNRLEDDAGFRFRVVTPLPFRLGVHGRLHDVVPRKSVAATIGGDLQGEGALSLMPQGIGTRLSVRWDIEVV